MFLFRFQNRESIFPLWPCVCLCVCVSVGKYGRSWCKRENDWRGPPNSRTIFFVFQNSRTEKGPFLNSRTLGGGLNKCLEFYILWTVSLSCLRVLYISTWINKRKQNERHVRALIGTNKWHHRLITPRSNRSHCTQRPDTVTSWHLD